MSDSQWNLSVRLTGQGSDLARTLRDTSRDARTASRDVNTLRRDIGRLRQAARGDIRVRVRLDADNLRSDVRNALNTAGTGQGLAVNLRVNADNLRNEVRTALNTAGAGQGLAVNLRLGDTMQLRRDVQAAVRWAAFGHRITIPIGLDDPMQLRRDVAAAVRWASMNQTITVRVTPDTSALNGLNNTINRGGGSSGGGDGFGIAGLLPIATAAIPLIAGLSTSLAPLPGALAAATVPAAAFAIALAGQIEPLTEVADAETKYQEAVREHGKYSTKAVEAQVAYQQVLAELPPQAQQAAIAISQLKQNFSEWSDGMSTFTMKPLTNGITVLDQIIPRLSPHVEAASTQLDRLVNIAGGAVQTPGFDAMADRFADFTDRQLADMTDGVIHFLRVLSEGGAFQNGPIAEFMAYARDNGPAAREALQAISEAVVTLLRAASEAGPTMLTLVTAAARLVAALPPELVGIILQVATALKLLQLSGAGMAAVAAGLGRVRTALTGMGATAAAAGGGLAGLRAAFLALGTAAKASIIIAGIGLAVVAISKLMNLGREAPPDIDKLTTSLGKLGQSGKVSGELGRLGKNLDDLYDKVRNITDPATIDNVQNGLVKVFSLGMADSTPSQEAREWLDSIDEGLTNLVKGGKPELAAAAYERLKAAYGKGGKDVSQFTKQMDDYKSSLADIKFEQELAADGMGLFGKAAQETSATLAEQKASADGLRQSILALNDVNRAAGSAMSAFEQSLDDTTKAVKKNAGVLKMRDGELDLGTQKARDAEKVLSDLAANTDAAAAAAREQGKSWEHVNGIMTEGRTAFIEAADTLGLTRSQAEALADSYLKIPDKKSTVLEMRTEDAVTNLNSVIAAIKRAPDEKSVTVKALTSDAQVMLRDLGFKVTQLPDGRFKVEAKTGDAGDKLRAVQALRDGLKDKSITVSSNVSEAIADLEEVRTKVAGTKGKTITMSALTGEARAQLEQLGFKIKNTKGKTVTISVPTGGQKAGVDALKAAINALKNKSVTITTTRKTIFESVQRSGGSNQAAKNAAETFRANGGVFDYFANGGIRRGGVRYFANGGENHVAQIARAGDWRVWAEDETGGESYIPLHPSKRVRSRAIAEETVRRLGGDPREIQWNAAGSVTDWRYDPTTGSLYSASDAGAAGNKTRKVKVKVKGKWQTKEVEYFDITAVEKKLKSAAKATQAWNADLQKVADRVGGDVAEALASMGKEGMKLADKMANGSTKYINDMAKALRDLQKTAKASLTDYTRQLTNANKLNKDFADDLAKLAAMGYGDLASQLASQNDTAAQQLADAASKDKSKAAKANAQAKTANNALTADQVQSLVQIIAAIKTKTTGIHDVAGTTGLGEDVIIDIGNKAKGQIVRYLGDRASRFMLDLKHANAGQAYADGGIRAGMYATRAGIIRFAEPSTGGEAYLPLGSNKRSTAMPVLRDVAHRFGVGLTDGQSSRVVIIREQGPMVGSSHFHIGDRRSDRDLARDIEARQAYQLRRLARGGAFAGSAGGSR
ncbi:hypothetical protein ACIQUW_33325 [Streptomyces sp. NPDC101117]|uniref:hypothetical protein n=1 Tax=Streptomyces sp. NPDC101117 TaxID=3366108 RepID=UPI003800CE3E